MLLKSCFIQKKSMVQFSSAHVYYMYINFNSIIQSKGCPFKKVNCRVRNPLNCWYVGEQLFS